MHGKTLAFENILASELRKKVQSIVTTIDQILHLKEMFHNVSRDLETGYYYCYLDDMSTNCIDKK